MGGWECFRGDPGEERLVDFTRAGYLFGIASRLHLLVGLLDRLQPLVRACVRLLTQGLMRLKISWRVQALLKFVLVSL